MEGLKSMDWAVASNHFEAWLCPRMGHFPQILTGISDFAPFWANVYQCGRFVAGKSGKWPCPSDNGGGPDRNGWSTKIGSASPSLWGVESQQLPDTLLLQRISMGETKLVIVHQCPPQELYRAAGTWQIVAVLILSLKYSRHIYILLAIILSRILHFWRESWSSTATTNWIMNWAKDHSVARLSRCWDDGMDMRYANALARRYLRFSTEPKENQRMSANSLWDFRSYFGVLNILKTRLWFAKHCDCASLSQKVSSQRIFQVLPVAACCTDCAGTLPDRSRWSPGQNESIHRGHLGGKVCGEKFSCFGFQKNIIDMMWHIYVKKCICIEFNMGFPDKNYLFLWRPGGIWFLDTPLDLAGDCLTNLLCGRVMRSQHGSQGLLGSATDDVEMDILVTPFHCFHSFPCAVHFETDLAFPFSWEWYRLWLFLPMIQLSTCLWCPWDTACRPLPEKCARTWWNT